MTNLIGELPLQDSMQPRQQLAERMTFKILKVPVRNQERILHDIGRSRFGTQCRIERLIGRQK